MNDIYNYMWFAVGVIFLLILIGRKVTPYLYKRRMERLAAQERSSIHNATTLTITQDRDTRLLVELINRCIAYGDHVIITTNFRFESEDGEVLPHLVVHIKMKTDSDRILFQSEVEGSGAQLVWYRVTRENGFTTAGSKHIEFNAPEKG